jgi:AcrR family transcriptional regulator
MKDTKQRIMTIALGLFLRKSFREVTMNELVAATKMSKGAFYHYFESKEQLFLELLNSYFFDSIAVDYAKFSHESLYAFSRDYVADVSQRMRRSDGKRKNSLSNINFYFLIFDGIKLFPEFRKKVKETQDREQKAWETIVRIAREKGEIKSPMSNEQIAKYFIFITDGIGMRLIVENKIEEMMDQVVLLWDGFYKQLKA